MTEEEKLIALKAMVGGSDSDEVLSTYLKLAGRKIINRAYPYDSSVTEVPAQYDTLRDCRLYAEQAWCGGSNLSFRERYLPKL